MTAPVPRPVDVHALPAMLTALRLPSIQRHWPALAGRADAEGWPASRFLAALAEIELADRDARRIQRHLRESGLPGGKTLATFDFKALAGSVYRDGLFPRSEYEAAWAALSTALPRRDACRRMVDLLWLAHDEACEAELAGLIAGVLDEGLLPEARALKPKLVPRRRELPGDTPVTLTDLSSFDALLEGRA